LVLFDFFAIWPPQNVAGSMQGCAGW